MHDENTQEEIGTLDELTQLETDDPIFTAEEPHKVKNRLQDLLPLLPEDVKKHVANIRADYTRKTQELARAKQEIEQQRLQMDTYRDKVFSSDVFRGLEEITGKEVDLYSPEGLQEAIEIAAARKLQELYRPLQEQVEQEKAQAKVQSFIAQNPDVKSDPDIKSNVAKLLQEREDLTIEDAYYIAKAKVMQQRQATEQQSKRTETQARRDTFAKTSTGSTVASKAPPPGLTPVQALEWFSKNS
jgi:hypothetical protein